MGVHERITAAKARVQVRGEELSYWSGVLADYAEKGDVPAWLIADLRAVARKFDEATDDLDSARDELLGELLESRGEAP